MPERVKLKKQITIKQFARKKILVSILPNMFFNTLICYYSFTQFNVLYLIEGIHSLAKLMLSMAAFLPIMITFDILWNARKMSQQGEIDIVLDEYFNKNKSIFKTCGINGLYTWLCALVVVLVLYLSLPYHYKFNGITMAVAGGVLAGVFTVIFTLVSIKQLKKHIITPIELPVSV